MATTALPRRRGRRKVEGAHPLDRHLGAKILERRTELGMSLSRLGEATGVRAQQIQKYEHGANRVSASMLWEIARALEVPVTHFFEGFEDLKN
jgi:transcriptional regulator with XRE-family HTH domain